MRAKSLHRAFQAGTTRVNDSGVDGRDSRGLDDDGGSRGLRTGGCAGKFWQNAIPAWLLRIACGSSPNARAHAHTKTTWAPRYAVGVFLDWEAQCPGTPAPSWEPAASQVSRYGCSRAGIFVHQACLLGAYSEQLTTFPQKCQRQTYATSIKYQRNL